MSLSTVFQLCLRGSTPIESVLSIFVNSEIFMKVLLSQKLRENKNPQEITVIY